MRKTRKARVSRWDLTQPHVNRVLSQPTDGHTVSKTRAVPIRFPRALSTPRILPSVFRGESHLEGECVICVCMGTLGFQRVADKATGQLDDPAKHSFIVYKIRTKKMRLIKIIC